MLKHKILPIASTLLLAIMMTCVQKPVYTQTDKTLNVEIESVEILDKQGIYDESGAHVNTDNTALLNTGTLSMPGAYVCYGITLHNTGSLTAHLTDEQEVGSGIEDIYVCFPHLSCMGDEVINPGERCRLEMVVYWDKNSERGFCETQVSELLLRLNYTNSDIGFELESNTNSSSIMPSTGDVCSVTAPLLLIMCGSICIICCLPVKRRTKCDDKAYDSTAKE